MHKVTIDSFYKFDCLNVKFFDALLMHLSNFWVSIHLGNKNEFYFISGLSFTSFD